MGRADDVRPTHVRLRLKSGSRAADTLTVAARWLDRSRIEGDLGVIVVGTLAKVLLVLAVVGVVGYDAFSVTTTQLSLRDHAQQAAVVGHDAYRASGNPQAAYAAALAYARQNGYTLVRSGFSTGPDHRVTIELRREAPTVIAGHLPRVKDYTIAVTTATASDPG